jgi:hypothetical protein
VVFRSFYIGLVVDDERDMTLWKREAVCCPIENDHVIEGKR